MENWKIAPNDPKWSFPKMGIPPNHPFLWGFSIINHPFWGIPIYENPQIILSSTGTVFLSAATLSTGSAGSALRSHAGLLCDAQAVKGQLALPKHWDILSGKRT